MIELSFTDKSIRFVGTAERPEWVGADVVNVLYPAAIINKNQSTYLARIPDEWKSSKRIATPGGEQEMTTVFEPGLYALITRSNSPVAVPFQRWVFEEVLPEVRKQGGYQLKKEETFSLSKFDSIGELAEIETIRMKAQRTEWIAYRTNSERIAILQTQIAEVKLYMALTRRLMPRYDSVITEAFDLLQGNVDDLCDVALDCLRLF